jgi:hypothetical protein
MKYLFAFLLTCISFISLAQELQKPTAPKSPRERRHMIVLDGVKTWGVSRYTISSYGGKLSRYYSANGASVGYRYCFYDFFRVGVNFDINAIDILRGDPAYIASFHIESPIPVGDKFFISPSLIISYDGINDVPNGKFRVSGSVGFMYMVTKGLAINLEPGYSYYKPLFANEFSVRLGLRFLF